MGKFCCRFRYIVCTGFFLPVWWDMLGCETSPHFSIWSIAGHKMQPYGRSAEKGSQRNPVYDARDFKFTETRLYGIWLNNFTSFMWAVLYYRLMFVLCIWVRSQNCSCLVTWFCYQLIAKPGPVFYLCLRTVLDSKNLISLLAKIISFSVPVLATRS